MAKKKREKKMESMEATDSSGLTREEREEISKAQEESWRSMPEELNQR